MSENKKKSIQAPKYETPAALRLVDLQKGKGLCQATGSGDAEACDSNGNMASPPGEGCVASGNSAVGFCTAPGSGVDS